MNNLLLLVSLLSFLVVLGYWQRFRHGKLKKVNGLNISAVELNQKLGKKATIVQFSTTFCSECRTAKAIVNDVVKDFKDIAYVEVDAESNLELVRRVDIRSTPTTIFLDSKGFEIARAKGAPKRDQLIKAIKAI
jgi:thiol-disulfide isomerase/thioredoxin